VDQRAQIFLDNVLLMTKSGAVTINSINLKIYGKQTVMGWLVRQFLINIVRLIQGHQSAIIMVLCQDTPDRYF
jgi:hypothetical protein